MMARVPKENPKEKLDKMYYFDNEKVVKELKSNKEVEHSIRTSDAEELLAEFYEYVEIFNKSSK